ncbi:putative sec23/Sec24 helical domain containing protein [Lyophyllum shimeji]|uniref:Sec23/Sec24 helical domain containing protein n=1 Tax=Lyophyllum shimeji TaxID=47721 RepID=A0A9P3UNV7_LYOSH|nr:putative sec23/Sec24 helical domain containing protein [Lyophyllum shimeji]
MASPAAQLPPGWTAEWDATHQRYLFIESASGHTQWEPPQVAPAGLDQQPSVSPPPVHHTKRRQYAAGQTQAYYGAETLADPTYQGGPQQQQAAGGQLFTPGLVAEHQFQAQQGQPPAPGQPAYFQPGQEPEYINGPAYGQQPQPGYAQAPMDALAGQFGQMGMGGQKQFQLYTTNLLTSPPEPRELYRPPPEIRLPPNSCISPSPLANADPSYKRCTLNAIPTTSSLLGKAKIPLALVITPYRSLMVAIAGDAACVTCRMRCPSSSTGIKFAISPATGGHVRSSTILLLNFVAPTEYMVRPPQPAVYVFLIDVSHSAVQSGMVATATRTILENLDRIPDEDERTKVAIICYDTSLYFFSLPPGSTDSTMLVVSDIDDVFLPKPSDLLVNLVEARAGLENLLGRINDMFQDNTVVGSAMGPALQAGFKLMSPIGGKIIVLASSLPSVGAGALKNREDPKILGTAKESGLLQAASPFYKTFAIECSRAHVSVDMFLFSAGYTDVASLACLPHYTSWPDLLLPCVQRRADPRMRSNSRTSSERCWQCRSCWKPSCVCVLHAACAWHRSTATSSCARQTCSPCLLFPRISRTPIEIQIEETITSPFVVFQTAVLHTTCYGERRIRVVTLALPTTSNLSEVFASADQVAIATLLANKAVERALTHKLEDSRDYIFQRLVDILVSYKASMTSGGAGASAQLAISDNMKMLPVLVLGLLKNVGIRQSAQIPPDIRAYSQCLLTSLPSQLLIPYIYPTFYSFAQHATRSRNCWGERCYPTTRPAPYVGAVGETWSLIMDVFNLPNYEVLRGGKTTLPVLDNPFSQRVNAVIQKTREMRRGVYYPHLYVVKDDGEPPLRLWGALRTHPGPRGRPAQLPAVHLVLEGQGERHREWLLVPTIAARTRVLRGGERLLFACNRFQKTNQSRWTWAVEYPVAGFAPRMI